MRRSWHVRSGRAAQRGRQGAVSYTHLNLTWTQTGSSLSGSIDLTPGGTESLTGTVSGNTLQFGAVGSEAITYNGTVSGDSSMSGSYSVAGMGGGSWTASKTS